MRRLLPTAGLRKLAWPGRRPDLAVNLHGRGPESIADLLAQKPAEIITYAHLRYPGIDGPRWDSCLHEGDRWCRLLEYGHIAADRKDLALPRPALPSPAPGAVVIHPGAAFGARRWPAERFARVARALAGHGESVVIAGGPDERTLATQVASAAGLPLGVVLVGRTDLPTLAALIVRARLAADLLDDHPGLAVATHCGRCGSVGR